METTAIEDIRSHLDKVETELVTMRIELKHANDALNKHIAILATDEHRALSSLMKKRNDVDDQIETRAALAMSNDMEKYGTHAKLTIVPTDGLDFRAHRAIKAMNDAYLEYNIIDTLKAAKGKKKRVFNVRTLPQLKLNDPPEEVKDYALMDYVEILKEDYTPTWTTQTKDNQSWQSFVYNGVKMVDDTLVIGKGYWVTKRDFYTDRHNVLVKCTIKRDAKIALSSGYVWNAKKGSTMLKLITKDSVHYNKLKSKAA